VPSLALADQSGHTLKLRGFLGEPVVLFFFPKAGSASCTKELEAFNAALDSFAKLDVTVIGVSPDPSEQLEEFTREHRIEFPLLSDPPRRHGPPPTLNKFGVWGEKHLYGRKYFGVLRTTYLIDAHQRVVRRWDNVKVPGHVEQVLRAVREMI
jgi:peroxiredoxin Q/BCP